MAKLKNNNVMIVANVEGDKRELVTLDVIDLHSGATKQVKARGKSILDLFHELMKSFAPRTTYSDILQQLPVSKAESPAADPPDAEA